MKARKITKAYVHYLKSNEVEKSNYHFLLTEDGSMICNMPIFSNSIIDNDSEALHFGCVGYSDLPQKVTELLDIMGHFDAQIIEVTEEPKPKKKKK